MKTTHYKPENKQGLIDYLTEESKKQIEEVNNGLREGRYDSERWYNADIRSINEALSEKITHIGEGFDIEGYSVRQIKKFLRMFGGTGSVVKYSSCGSDWETTEIVLGNNSATRKSPTRSATGRNY